MNSNHYIPTTACKTLVHSFWQAEGSPTFHKEHILPKGIIEIIFNFSDGSSIGHLGSNRFSLSKCFISGFNKMPITLQLPKQQVFFGVRLQPLAVKKLFKTAASEFSDVLVDLALIDTGFHSLWDQLACKKNFDDRVTVFCNWIEHKLQDSQPQEKLINDFLYGMNQHDLSVTELADTVCYSTRQLSRKIFEATGMNTEEILLYKKYLHAIHLIHHTDLSLTSIAYQSSFSDQSHFIRSFRSYTEMTPGDYKRQKGYLAGHIYKDVR